MHRHIAITIANNIAHAPPPPPITTIITSLHTHRISPSSITNE
jgi:hypothetical protein